MGGFPVSVVPLVRCTGDGGNLSIWGERGGERRDGFVVDGRAVCATCGAEFAIRGGILDLLGDAAITDPESSRERDMRDVEASTSRGAPGMSLSRVDDLEIASTMRRLGPLAGKTVVELGCGAGVYTRLLASAVHRVLAVDFSWAHLVLNAHQATFPDRVGFARADVATLKLAAAAFDLAFTTLYSNLPTRDLREAMNALVRAALQPGGQYLVSAHHQDLRRRLRRTPAVGRYAPSGIFFESLTAAGLAGELADFARVDVAPAAISLPFVNWFVRDSLQRRVERIPVVNQLGAILLADARKGPS